MLVYLLQQLQLSVALPSGNAVSFQTRSPLDDGHEQPSASNMPTRRLDIDII